MEKVYPSGQLAKRLQQEYFSSNISVSSLDLQMIFEILMICHLIRQNKT